MIERALARGSTAQLHASLRYGYFGGGLKKWLDKARHSKRTFSSICIA